jgi:hypothetical protein
MIVLKQPCLLLVLQLFIIQSALAQPPFQVDSNTLALWRFDQITNDTIYDQSGHGNNLKLIGSASLVKGVYNNAIRFFGDSGYLFFRPKNSIPYSNGLSIEILYYPFGMQDGSLQLLPTCQISTDGFHSACTDPNNTNYLNFYSALGSMQRWNYLKVVFNNDSTLYFLNYNDRGAIKNTPLTFNRIDSIYVGKVEIEGMPSYFEGYIDEIKISYYTENSKAVPYKYSNTWRKNILTCTTEWVQHGLSLKGGGYAVTGGTKANSKGDVDVLLAKIDSFGDSVWIKTYGGAGRDLAYWVEQTNDSGFIVAGLTASRGNGKNDILILKTDRFGDTLWTQTFGTANCDEAFCVKQKKDGGYFASGIWGRCTTIVDFGGYYRENGDLWIADLDEKGSLVRQRTYDFPQSFNRNVEFGDNLFEDENGDIVIIGNVLNTQSNDRPLTSFFFKVNKQGDSLEKVSLPGTNRNCAIQTGDGGYMVVTSRIATFGTTTYANALVDKINSHGTVLWEKSYGGPDNYLGNTIQSTADGGFIIGASLRSTFKIYTTDNVGTERWNKAISGGLNVNSIAAAMQTDDRGYFIADEATTYAIRTSSYIVMIKTDSTGYYDATPFLRAASPLFSPGGGLYTGGQNVAITCSTSTAVIHYTVDGSEPDENSPVYVNPVSISKKTLLRAMAYDQTTMLVFSQIRNAIYDFPPPVTAHKNDLCNQPRNPLWIIDSKANAAVKFVLLHQAHVKIALLNTQGRTVYLLESDFIPGRHIVNFKNKGGRKLSSGVYLYKININAEEIVNRMFIL